METELQPSGVLNVLITGASVSYNRYSYDKIHRINAYDCLPAMPSWSFRLRDKILKQRPNYLSGKSMDVSGGRIALPKEVSAASMMVINNRSCRVIAIDDNTQNVSIRVPIRAEKFTLVMQKSALKGCTFDIYCDGLLCKEQVSSYGNMQYFHGMAPYTVELQGRHGDVHNIEFTNIKKQQDTAYIILTAACQDYINVFFSGQGSTCASFLIDNFDERIATYNPDIVVLTTGANDRARISADQYGKDVDTLFSKIKQVNTNCEIIAISAPDSSLPGQPDGDNLPHYISPSKSQPYYDQLESACDKYAAHYMHMPSMFTNIPIEKWRFDNVHLNRFGNNVLHNAVYSLLRNIIKQKTTPANR